VTGIFDWTFLLFVLAQRVFELLIAKRHEKKLKDIGARELDKGGYVFIVGMHIAFFVSLILEKSILNRSTSEWWIILIIIFCVAQALRYWAIASLGIYWNTKILVAPNHPLVRNGPYKILRHPNYIAVITELAVIPLIFSCYITSISFTVLNAIIIRRRIRIETQALNRYPQ
jgi:methyltransferase